MNLHKIKRAFGALLIASGVLLVFGPHLYKIYLEQAYAQDQAYAQEIIVSEDSYDPINIDEKLLKGERRVEEEPKKIIISSLGIDLEVKSAEVKKGKWEVFDDKASYGIGSGVPGVSGNTVVFAHAQKGLFLPLKEIKKDTEVLILTQGKWYSYKVVETKEVLPKDISVISPTEDETLTLYTCTGFADSKRLIVVAKRG